MHGGRYHCACQLLYSVPCYARDTLVSSKRHRDPDERLHPPSGHLAPLVIDSSYALCARVSSVTDATRRLTDSAHHAAAPAYNPVLLQLPHTQTVRVSMWDHDLPTGIHS